MADSESIYSLKILEKDLIKKKRTAKNVLTSVMQHIQRGKIFPIHGLIIIIFYVVPYKND